MKVECFREAHCLDDVSILGLSSAEVPVWEMLEDSLVDVTFGIHAEAPAGEGLELPGAPQRIRFRTGSDPKVGEVSEVVGMIIGEGVASLIAFLEDRYLPDEATGRTVDRLLAQLGRGELDRADCRRVVERMFGANGPRRSHRRASFDGDDAMAVGFLGTRKSFYSALEQRHDAGGAYLLRSLRGSANLGIATSYEESIEGHRVPRWRFVLAGEEGGVGGWDGRRFHVAQSFDLLPDSLRRSLDREGRIVVQDRTRFVPMTDLRAEFLVRVPFADELGSLSYAGPLPKGYEHMRPVLLVDSRSPIVLRGIPDLFVVEEPEEALAFLARRTGRGAYVPGMPPAPIADLKLSTPGQGADYLVGCWPS